MSRRPLSTRILDLAHNAWLGVSGRVSRTLLSALGIALGVAAYVALSGVAASNQAALLARLDRLGANLSVVTPADGASGKITIPEYAPDTLRRQSEVENVGVFHALSNPAIVTKNEFIPASNGNGIGVTVMEPGALTALGTHIAQGRGITSANEDLPVTVLGSEAAYRLAVTSPGDRVLIDNTWYGVIGILEPTPQAPSFDTTALIGGAWAKQHYASDEHVGDISVLYVRTAPGDVQRIRRLLSHAANPGGGLLTVDAAADLSKARAATDDSMTTLGALIGVIALFIGGMSIANMMVVTVMERRGEIGLRRALGATPGAVRIQFVSEAALLSALGAVVGALLGMGGAMAAALWQKQPPALAWSSLPLACGAAMLVGVLAGLYPASRAARMTPVEALRGE